MDIQLKKLELIEMLLNTKKQSVLEKVKMLLEAEQEDILLTKEQYKIIDKRREEYLKGKSKSINLDQLTKDVLKVL